MSTLLNKLARGWPSSPLATPLVPAEIDWKNPLTRELYCCVLLNGDRAVDLVDPSRSIIYSSTTSIGVGLYGAYGLKQSTDGFYACTVHDIPYANGTGDITLVWYGDHYASGLTADNSNRLEYRNDAYGTSGYFALNTGTTRQVIGRTYNSYTSRFGYSYAYPLPHEVKQNHVIAVDRKGSNGDQRTIINGDIKGTASPGSAVDVLGGGGNPILLINQGQSTTNPIGYLALVFNRLLSAEEHKLLAKAPCQFLKPANSSPFMMGVTDGTAVDIPELVVLSDIAATNITGSSVIPQVTITWS